MSRITNRLGWGVAGALAIALIAAVAGIIQAGPLDPPAPPGSTLPQVEPRVPISSLPFTISEPGSYFVTKNLYAASGDGITVASDAVDIDLNGFTLDGPGSGAGDGITGGGVTRSDVTVRNGTLRSWGDDGIDLAASLNVRIANVSVHYNGGSGIETGSGTVDNCVVTGDGLVGVRASAPATISNCVVQGYGTGLALNSGGAIRDSVSVAAGETGIYLAGGGTISGSTVNGVGGGVGPNKGIVVNGQSLVENNLVTNIANSAFPDPAIGVAGPANTITGNAISFSEYGFNFLYATNTKIYGNSLSNVTTYLWGGTPTDGDDIGPMRAYSDNGSWDQRLSAVTGWDSCYSARFRCVMNNEAVLDRETGLVWQRSPTTTLANWMGAANWCWYDRTGGRMGWRLPTAPEITSLFDPSASGDHPLPAGHPFTIANPSSYVYWTAYPDPTDSSRAIDFWFASGIPSGAPRTSTLRYWCVRGDSPDGPSN